jgi:4-hydroxybutyrate CoA-transferase
MAPELRAGLEAGRVEFLPMQMRAAYEFLGAQRFDVVFTQVAYDRDGQLRFGPNVDFIEAALEGAGCVVAELNRAFVAPAGAPRIDSSRIDHLVESNRALGGLPPAATDTAAREIGRIVASLIPDGACLQTGIGAIPAAILGALGDKNDLGLHSGLIDDAGRELIDQGVITGARKMIDANVHVVGMGIGGAGLFDWLAETPSVVLKGANYTHEVAVIAQLERFISINSAVEVDLLGQVNAEFAAGRQISGTGGSVDFMRAAKSSPGGRSIIAMTATAGGGRFSRIVAGVPVVTALRTDVDIVVTEFGIAELGPLDLAARAEALIAIAAPEFREGLRAQM